MRRLKWKPFILRFCALALTLTLVPVSISSFAAVNYPECSHGFSTYNDHVLNGGVGEYGNARRYYWINPEISSTYKGLKGELKEGDKISAYKLGGYIQLKHSDPDIQQRYPEVTDGEMENKVFDRRIDGDPHPTVGQEGVFFLKPKVGDMPEGLYLITDGYDGQFMKRTDGNYARHYEGNASFEQNQGLVGYSLDDPGSAYETDRSQQTGLNGVLSYESIKAALTE